MSVIDISGLDKAEVLHALYHRSHVQGLGILQAIPEYTVDDARKDLDEQPGYYFDYLHGRVLKVDLFGDSFDSWLYDRDCGEGAAEAAINELRRRNDSPGHSSGD
jgi:hypothetical protein